MQAWGSFMTCWYLSLNVIHTLHRLASSLPTIVDMLLIRLQKIAYHLYITTQVDSTSIQLAWSQSISLQYGFLLHDRWAWLFWHRYCWKCWWFVFRMPMNESLFERVSTKAPDLSPSLLPTSHDQMSIFHVGCFCQKCWKCWQYNSYRGRIRTLSPTQYDLENVSEEDHESIVSSKKSLMSDTTTTSVNTGTSLDEPNPDILDGIISKLKKEREERLQNIKLWEAALEIVG